MTAAVVAWMTALAQDLAGAPPELQAAAGGIAVGAAVLIAWGAAAELRVRAFRKQAKAAERLSRSLFAAAGVKRWRR
jgi:threonine/homoserine/homoserine lactone efflux protein